MYVRKVLMTRIYSADTSEIFIFLVVTNSQSWARLSAVTEFKHDCFDNFSMVNIIGQISAFRLWTM